MLARNLKEKSFFSYMRSRRGRIICEIGKIIFFWLSSNSFNLKLDKTLPCYHHSNVNFLASDNAHTDMHEKEKVEDCLHRKIGEEKILINIIQGKFFNICTFARLSHEIYVCTGGVCADLRKKKQKNLYTSK